MIKVEGLTKRYARHVAVNNISFEVAKGEIVGFLGKNGAGKTTTMRVLTCFLPPMAGIHAFYLDRTPAILVDDEGVCQLRIFTPAQPTSSAASLRDFCCGVP